MPTGKRPITRRPRTRRAQNADPIELVVRRGALRRFDALKRETAELPVVVSWDRRTIERRGTDHEIDAERRKADRRQQPPFTWEMADFVVVCQPPDPSASRTPEATSKTNKRAAVAKA